MAVAATVEGERFSGVDGYAEDLSGRSFRGCAFLDCDLTVTTSRGAAFDRCEFRGTRLNSSTHEDTAFTQCTFEQTSLFSATLAGASSPAPGSFARY